MKKSDILKILTQMSLRNLRSRWAKTLIVGSILFFGTALWTIGSSLIGSIETAMSRTIVKSVTGHLQVYEEDTRDELAIFGGGTFGAPDIGEIPKFKDVLAAADTVSNIESVVPMGTTVALMTNPSRLDSSLADLRDAVYAEDRAAQAEASAQVKYQVGLLLDETRSRLGENEATPELAETIEDMEYALSAAFWASFKEKPLEQLEFLDTRIAPLGTDGDLVYLRLLGTDIPRYREVFTQFKLVEGEAVPEGERGALMPDQFRERIKNRVARAMDDMKERVEDGYTFADDEALQEKSKRTVRQYKRLLLDLAPENRQRLHKVVQDELGKTGSLDTLLQEFLRVDDANFESRYQAFYDRIAPLIQLYPVQAGDTITVRAFSRSGYMRSANLKLYGIYTFEGMEDSDLAGVYNIVDMMTFRELYGAITASQREELAGIKEDIGIEDVGRSDAEAALFGGDDFIVEEDSTSELDVDSLFDSQAVQESRAFTREDVDRGLALHAAIVLENPDRIEETRLALEEAFDRAGLPLRVVTWQDAAGFVGQLTVAMRAVLIFGMFIIFLVALVVVNNTVLISVMERTNEIGTLRAIGAQRPFVLLMFLMETMAIAVIAGVLGAFAGALIIEVLGVTGVPAFTKQVNFLFGGPRLYPHVGLTDMVGGLVIILIVSLVATFFPARSATGVQPVEAMRGAE